MKTLLTLLAWMSVCALPARAWGPEGHQAVGWIAAQFLYKETRAQVDAILQNEDMGSLPVTGWADFIRRNKGMERVYPENRRWHYIDAPMGAVADSVTPTADGHDVVSQVERWHAVYADPAIAATNKRDALRFLIHFVADLHQPLHCADREGDRGGNLMPVQSFRGAHFEIDATGMKEDLPNLHRVWDDYLVYELMAGADVTNFTLGLIDSITAEQVVEWTRGRAVDWATETHRLAEERAYRFADGTPLPLPLTTPAPDFDRANYIDGNAAVAREQLQKAGVRLAELLNQALAEPAAQPAPSGPTP